MQASFAQMGTPLSEVVFVVVDLETTGGPPGADAITAPGRKTWTRTRRKRAASV